MAPKIPKTLEDRLKEGKVIPFVGAGVSRAVLRLGGQPLFPSWFELLQAAARKLDEEQKPKVARYVESAIELGPSEYLQAAQKARDNLEGTWADFLRAQFDPPFAAAENDSLALARAIWNLGSQLIVTTNYDRALIWACPEQYREEVRVWDIENKAEQAQLLRAERADRPIIWHLHGQIENASDLILTPDGYERLYPSQGEGKQRHQAALSTLQTLLASRSLLFIGFSLDDAAFGVQLKRVSEVFGGNTGPHYALVRERDSSRLKEQGLPVELVTFEDFGAPLLELVQKLGDLGDIAKETKSRDAESPIDKEVVVAAIHAGTASIAPFSPDNRPFFVPFRPKGDRMIGRAQSLQRVRDQLLKGSPTNIGQTASFQGLGGLGKTQLAVEYAYEFRDQYPNGVIWLTADQDIPAQLTQLAVEARWVAPTSEHRIKLEIAQHRLRSYPGCLLIFDNLEDHASIEPYLPPPNLDVHLLATSRTEQTFFRAVDIAVLDEEASVTLLVQEAGRDFRDAEDAAAARGVACELGGLPLALEMAGAYVSRRRLSWSEYRELLDRRPRDVLRSKGFPSLTDHNADLYATLQISEEIFEEEPELRNILDILTWSASATMGISLLAALLQREPVDLYSAVGFGEELRLLEEPRDDQRSSMHRLLRKVRQDEGPAPSERMDWFEQISLRLGDWFAARRQNFSDLATFEAEIDHLRVWQEQAVRLGSAQASRLLWLQAYPSYHRGQYGKAHEQVARAKEFLEARRERDDGLEAWLWDDLGVISQQLGRRNEAKDYAFRSLELRHRLLGRQHTETARSLTCIGNAYRFIGDAKKALLFLSDALEIQLSMLGKQHPDIATSLGYIGLAHQSMGDAKEALLFYSRALEMQSSILGEQHPETATTLHCIGAAHQDLGDAKRSLLFYFQALEILRSMLGERHPETATVLGSIGSAYQDLGEAKQSLLYYSQALEIQCSILGEQHPATAITLYNIGTVHSALGDEEKSLQFFYQTLEIERSFLGKRHPETISTVLSIASRLSNLDRRQEAYQLIEPYLRELPEKDELRAKLRTAERQLLSKPLRTGFRQPSSKPHSKGGKKRRR